MTFLSSLCSKTKNYYLYLLKHYIWWILQARYGITMIWSYYIKATQYWKCKFLISKSIPLPNNLNVGYTQAISWGVLWLFLIIISCFCTALSKRQWTANGSKLRYDVLDTSFKASSQCPRFSNCPLVSVLYFKTHLQH